MASAFPRRIYANKKEDICWVLGDFCIEANNRSLGPAMQLQRACLAATQAEGIAFCYDFPNAGMMAVYQRLGIPQLARMIRLAKPLRVDRKIKEIVKSPRLANALATLGNVLLASTTRRPAKNGNLTISLHQGECGEEFSALAEEIGDRYGVCLCRTAEYLNWRYLNSTHCHHEIITARRTGRLAAYAVLEQREEDGLIVDLFGSDDPMTIRMLVEEVVVLFYLRGVFTVSIALVEYHPWIGLFRSLGFREREAKPLVVYAPNAMHKLEDLNWFFTHGDRDS